MTQKINNNGFLNVLHNKHYFSFHFEKVSKIIYSNYQVNSHIPTTYFPHYFLHYFNIGSKTMIFREFLFK